MPAVHTWLNLNCTGSPFWPSSTSIFISELYEKSKDDKETVWLWPVVTSVRLKLVGEFCTTLKSLGPPSILAVSIETYNSFVCGCLAPSLPYAK